MASVVFTCCITIIISRARNEKSNQRSIYETYDRCEDTLGLLATESLSIQVLFETNAASLINFENFPRRRLDKTSLHAIGRKKPLTSFDSWD